MNRIILIRLLLLVATLTVYWQVTSFEFVDFDDNDYVRDNPIVSKGLTAEGVRWAMVTPHAANWHPLTWLSLMLDANLYPGGVSNSGGYHFTNLVLHILNVLLLFGLLERMTGALWRSAFVAALFALHPLHVESVAWVTERKDVLSMFFWLAATWTYVKFARRDGRRWKWYFLTALLMALGLMAKPMLVTLPLVFLLLDYWPLNRMNLTWRMPGFWKSAGGLVLEKLPLLALSVVSSRITTIVQSGNGELQDGIWMPMSLRLANAVVSYVRYIGKMFWPVDLAALYPNPWGIGREFWTSGQVIAAAVLLVAITIAVIALSRKRRYFIVGWLWFLETMAPVIGIVQIGRHSMADRYTYVPLIGLYIIMAWGVGDATARWRRRAVPLGIAATIALVALASLTYRQASYWKNSISLFEHTLAVTNDNWLIQSNLAAILERQGRTEEALGHLREALRIFPECSWMHNHLGGILGQHDRLYEAQVEFEKAIELEPTNAEAHNNLGVILQKRGYNEEALEHFRESLRLDPQIIEKMKRKQQ